MKTKPEIEMQRADSNPNERGSTYVKEPKQEPTKEEIDELCTDKSKIGKLTNEEANIIGKAIEKDILNSSAKEPPKASLVQRAADARTTCNVDSGSTPEGSINAEAQIAEFVKEFHKRIGETKYLAFTLKWDEDVLEQAARNLLEKAKTDTAREILKEFYSGFSKAWINNWDDKADRVKPLSFCKAMHDLHNELKKKHGVEKLKK